MHVCTVSMPGGRGRMDGCLLSCPSITLSHSPLKRGLSLNLEPGCILEGSSVPLLPKCWGYRSVCSLTQFLGGRGTLGPAAGFPFFFSVSGRSLEDLCPSGHRDNLKPQSHPSSSTHCGWHYFLSRILDSVSRVYPK